MPTPISEQQAALDRLLAPDQRFPLRTLCHRAGVPPGRHLRQTLIRLREAGLYEVRAEGAALTEQGWCLLQ